jgi:hypothetical protein
VAPLEAVLVGDAEAQAMLESYRALDAAVKRELAVPVVNWDRLAEHLSGAIDDRTNYSIKLFPAWGKIAAAAAVLLAIGTVAVVTLRSGSHATNVAVNTSRAITPARIELAEVTGPSVETAMQSGVEDVTIGPSPGGSGMNYAAAEDLIYHTPRVVIASNQVQRQDMGAFPF